ncbi:MAG: GNAT family N-acyltransferase [Rhodospirillaceae bacterium]
MVEISTDPLNNADLRIGNLEVRLAATAAEIDAAQRLRYEIFYNEMAAQPSPEMAARCRDFDRYDDVCDHLLVIDHNRGDGPEGVVGTYRLIRRAVANRTGGFYSSSEYDISRLDSYPGEILELGRSCVDVDYRTRGTMQLLWRGIAAYVWELKIGLMFGCGSLRGTDLQALALPLSYLYFHHLAPEDLRPVALPDRFSDMRLMRPETINRREALGKLPPLIKGYLRLGGFVGDGAVIDHQFNTTDVCIVVKTELVTEKYYRHYDRQNTTTGKTGIPA